MSVASEQVGPPTRFDALATYVPQLALRWHPPTDVPSWIQIEGTLVSADISGFTALSERLAVIGREGAEELTNLLNDCFDGMIAAVHEQRGDIVKFGGDALLILFTGPGHADRACRATIAMRSVVAQPLYGRTAGRVQLAISQGMHSGLFSLYAVQAGHTELLITGPGATETVECESIVSAGDIMLSVATAALVDPALLSDPDVDGRRLLLAPPLGHDLHTTDCNVGSETDPAQFVPNAQREQILIGAPAEHRRVTVAFVKFSHTDHLEHDIGPDAVATLLQRLTTIVADAAQTNGVHWMATDIVPDGGKIILAAGAPTASEGDEDRMLRTVRTIIEQAGDFDVRIGVNYGPVFVGDLGASSRRTFTIMGDAVNLAARLMAKAKSGEAVASKALLDRARTRYAVEPLEPFLVKGKTEPINASVLGQLEGRDATSAGQTLALVGRRRELAELTAVVESALASHGGVAEIAGDAGTGKTRLLHEIHALSGLPHVTVVCGQYARSSPYFVLRLLLRTLAGAALVTPADEVGVLLTELVTRVAPNELPWLPLIALVADAEVEPTPEATRIAAAFRRERTHRAVGDLLTAVVRDPSVLVIEDAQWMDDASHEALEAIFETIDQRPWAVLLTRRPGPPLFTSLPDAIHSVVHLEALDSHETLDLAIAAAGEQGGLRPEEWDLLVERSGGNPLFLIELVTATQQGSGGALPDSIEALVTSRLDTLPAADRLLLREASVLGTFIDLDLLAIALADDSIRSLERWQSLDSFVMQNGDLLQFRHGMQRHVAYEGLSYRRRREMHHRVGEAIEARAGHRTEEWADLLSTHFHAAGSGDRAWRYSVVAGHRSRDKHANVEAAEFFARALDSGRAVGVSNDELAPVAEVLGDVSELAGRYDDADRAYRHASRLCATDLARAQLLHKTGVVRERTGRYSEALRWYRRGLNLLERVELTTDTAALRAKLSLAYAGVRYRQGRYLELVRWAKQASDIANTVGDRAALAHAYYLLDLGVFSLGRDHEEYRELALPIFVALGDDVGQCNVLNNLGIIDYHTGHWMKALDYYTQARQAAERAGDVVGAATGDNNIGEILCDQGRVDEALPLFRKALRVFRSASYPTGVAVATANLGRAEVLAHEHDAGLSHLQLAVSQFAELGAAAFVFATNVQLTEALLVIGRHSDALELADSLLRNLNEEGDVRPKVQLQRARAWALIRVGRLAEAADALADAIARSVGARYERALNFRAAAELARLGGDAAQAESLERESDELLSELGVVSVPSV